MGKTRGAKYRKSNLGYKPTAKDEDESEDINNSSMNSLGLDSSGKSDDNGLENVLQEEINTILNSDNIEHMDDSSSDDSDLELQFNESKQSGRFRHSINKCHSESTRSRYRRFSINSEDGVHYREQPQLDPDEDSGGKINSKFNKYPARRKRKVVRQHYPSFQQSGCLDEFSDDDEYSLKKMDDNVETLYDVTARRRKIIFCSTVATLIAIAIVIGISTGQSEKRDDAPSNDMSVAKPPNNIADLCSKKNISKKSGHNACFKACSHANCCMLPGAKSCFIQNEKICGMYSPCGILHSTIDGDPEGNDELTLPPPPGNIEDICADTSVQDVYGYVACEEICRKAQCCFVEVVKPQESNPYILKSCKSSFPSVCSKYQACSFLDSSSHGNSKNEGSLKTVDDICTVDKVSTKKGRSECEEICQPRSCCFAKSLTRNCSETNKEWCKEYSACSTLASTALKDDRPTFVTEANKSMVKMCSDISNLSDTEKVKCIDSCNVAICCFFSDSSCINIEACPQYEYCGKILTSLTDDHINQDFSVPSFNPHQDLSSGIGDELSISDPSNNLIDIHPETTIEKICSLDKIASETGLNDCVNACSNFMCCFDYEHGCSFNQKCTKYNACIILTDNDLSTSDKDGYDIKMNVEDACNIDFITDYKRKEACATLCEPHLCCFTGQCVTPECQEYQACGIIMNEKPKYGDSVAVNSLDDTLIALTEDNVKIFCDENLIEEDFYRYQCEDTCREALCCISRDGDCSDRTKYCSAFSLCDMVWKRTPNTTIEGNLPLNNSNTTKSTVSDPTDSDLTITPVLPPTTSPNYDSSLGTDLKKENEENIGGSKELNSKLEIDCAKMKCCGLTDNNNCYDKNPDECLVYLEKCTDHPDLSEKNKNLQDENQPNFVGDNYSNSPVINPTIPETITPVLPPTSSPNYDSSLGTDLKKENEENIGGNKELNSKLEIDCAKMKCCGLTDNNNCYDKNPDECLVYLEKCTDGNRFRRGLRENSMAV